jgi:hypothetical protein
MGAQGQQYLGGGGGMKKGDLYFLEDASGHRVVLEAISDTQLSVKPDFLPGYFSFWRGVVEMEYLKDVTRCGKPALIKIGEVQLDEA